MPEIHLLTAGYIMRGEDNRVGSSVSLIRADGALIVVDPGMVSSTSVITNALSGLGHQPDDVTDVIISHHHPDHTMNIALFPGAAVHDHWAVYRGDIWQSRPAEGFQVAPGVGLWETPGHTEQDITTLVETDEGVVAFTHLWFSEDGPAEDPVAVDPEALHLGRRRVLEVAAVVVPGHGPAFVPGPDTPR